MQEGQWIIFATSLVVKLTGHEPMVPSIYETKKVDRATFVQQTFVSLSSSIRAVSVMIRIAVAKRPTGGNEENAKDRVV